MRIPYYIISEAVMACSDTSETEHLVPPGERKRKKETAC